jgi:proteasome activator subunit 4
MKLLDIERLTIHDPDLCALPAIPDDINHASDRYLQKLKNYAKNLPYSIEPNSKMQELLDFILRRMVQSVEAKDYDPGLLQWDILFT